VARDRGSVRVLEVEQNARGDEGVGRAGADIEAANVVLATAIDAVEGRGDLATEAGDLVEHDAIAEDVVAFPADLQALHGEELAPGDVRCELFGFPADAGELERDVEVLAGVRTDGAIERREAEARRNHG